MLLNGSKKVTSGRLEMKIEVIGRTYTGANFRGIPDDLDDQLVKQRAISEIWDQEELWTAQSEVQ